MGEQPKSYISQMCARLVDVERETMSRLGEEKGGFFVNIADDWLVISGAITDVYSPAEQCNLVFHTAWGLFKDVCWLQLLFVAGNYPLLQSRLRYVWESVFRAYHAEVYAGPDAPGSSPDDKL